jgi:hypothetical protein
MKAGNPNVISDIHKNRGAGMRIKIIVEPSENKMRLLS